MLATYIMKSLKSLFPLTILTFFLPCHLPADVSKEIQLGVEAVAGYRSGYVYRGFELAESTIDFQVETENRAQQSHLTQSWIMVCYRKRQG